MSLIRKEVRLDYKKSNKVRRATLVVKWGFKTEEEFLAYLQEKPDAECEVKKTETASEKPKRGRKPGVKNTPKVEKIEEPAKPASSDKATDYVIAFDTTGSMSSYIASVRQHVTELIGTLFENTTNLRIKIVAFGDYCDMKSSTLFGKAYQTIELTDNKQALVNFVKNAENTGGGDGDEFYELVIRKINRETQWREGAAKSVLFIADEDPHNVGYTYRDIVKNARIDWREEAAEAAKMGIQYDTLRILSRGWYKELSAITGGVCMDFKNANKISKVVEGTVYARASSASFNKLNKSIVDSGDSELIVAFKSMSTLSSELE